MHHSFDIEIAQKYGVNVAVFINNMAFWIKHNMANDKHFHDGRFWTYNSVKAYATHFPYWTEKQVRTIIEQCVSHGLIVKGNYNERKYDQTQWYGFTDYGLKLLNLLICPNGQMDLPKSANGLAQKGKPIPDNKTDNKTDKRARTKSRAPLSRDFKPNQEMKALFLDTAKKCDISPNDLENKFFNIYLDSDKVSDDWNKILHNFLIREKPSFKKLKNSNSVETRSIIKEWGPGHETWESIYGSKNERKRDHSTID